MLSKNRYPSDSKEKRSEYYQRWKDKKLAQDPEFFSHNYQRKVAFYGKDYFNNLSNKWHRAHPEYFVEWRNQHPGYHSSVLKKWRNNNAEHHAEESRKWALAHPKVTKAHEIAYYSAKIPLAKFCEVCPEDDVRKATHRHHPDYDYPQIIVSCCTACHTYLNNERGNKPITEGKQE